jgi:TorA maturation chaperone TorD
MKGTGMNETRAALYHTFSEGFKEPTIEFVRNVLNGGFEEEVRSEFKRLGHEVDTGGLTLEADGKKPSEIHEWIVDEYYSLFKGPFPPYVVPVESVYKNWAEDNKVGPEMKNNKGCLMGDPAIDMIKRYEHDGIDIPKDFTSYPDHIILILEYGGLLCRQGSEEAQEVFATSHMDWLDKLRDEIYELSQNSFYRSLADVTLAFSKLEMGRFKEK